MPERVGRYEIRERIGQGAMAEVYRAYDPGIGRDLAIKLLKGEFRENAQYAGRFLREAKAAGALSHPNIVTIYDVGEEGGYPYIAMELLEGEPLDVVLERYGKLAPDDVLAIGLQLTEALAYAHGLGVVHRDIKPSNILLAPDGRGAKILDFGIARVAEAHVDEAETLRTQAGQVLGTPRYMSPEQALGQEIDGRSDLFSTGVVLYELLTGRRAFDGSSAATLALQITQQDPAPIGEVAPDAPRGLQFIISKLMAKRPDRRFADGAQAAEAFRREQAALVAAKAEARTPRRRLPLQVRLSLLMASVTTAVLLTGASVVVERQYEAMERMALTSGTAVAAFVASNVALQAADNASLPAAERDWLPVEAFVKSAVGDPNIRRLSVVDAEGVVRASSDPALVGRPHQGVGADPVLQKQGEVTVTLAGMTGAQDLRFVRPITYAGRSFGLVDVSLSKADLDAAARLSKMLMLALGLIIVMTVIGASYAVVRAIARPIQRLKAALDEAADGNTDFRISHSRSDEFGDLFDAFNRLTATVEARLEPGSGAPKPSELDQAIREDRTVVMVKA
ncbi:protein kinase domain-containing protein [Phenylobacterium sp.]|uniref:protein kinase domain-containing protein n=1 Tax=Phenylobacterium sp. TaxID=1871053 RepID=UPI002E31C1D9|nr:protein kinase [Phenylobacterium sp.]HEX2559632.1 protein kinase [Phenylobacterium sp.]